MKRIWWNNEAILARFRSWLQQTVQEVEEVEAVVEEPTLDHDEPAPPLPEVGLLQLAEALTAMRHELKLQTKSSRGLEDSVQAAVQGLDAAIDQFRSAEARADESARRAVQPFVETLVELDESLLRGGQAVEAARVQAARVVPAQLQETLDKEFRRLPAWRRWRAGAWERQVQASCAAELTESLTGAFASLREGFALLQSRMDRLLREHGVQRIRCVGQAVDPAQMTVVELIDDASVKPETVVEEIRPGYSYGGEVVRFAEVRASKGRPARPADARDGVNFNQEREPSWK